MPAKHTKTHTQEKSAVVLDRFVSYPRRFGVREPCQPPTCHCPFNEANTPKWRWGRNQKTPKSPTQCPQQILIPTSKRNKTKATQVYNKATYNNRKKRKRISSFILQTRHSAGEILTTPELQQIRLLKARETKQKQRKFRARAMVAQKRKATAKTESRVAFSADPAQRSSSTRMLTHDVFSIRASACNRSQLAPPNPLTDPRAQRSRTRSCSTT